MTRKATPWYPGKSGPAPKGLTRKILFPVALSDSEWEHLQRLEKKARAEDSPIHKKAQIIRTRVFPDGELERLRQEQGANITPATKAP